MSERSNDVTLCHPRCYRCIAPPKATIVNVWVGVLIVRRLKAIADYWSRLTNVLLYRFVRLVVRPNKTTGSPLAYQFDETHWVSHMIQYTGAEDQVEMFCGLLQIGDSVPAKKPAIFETQEFLNNKTLQVGFSI